MSQTQVFRDIPPDALLTGIMACGGVREYYNACIESERQERTRIAALSAASGMRVASPFPANAHEVIEQTVTQVGKKRMVLVPALMDAGLTTNLDNWWAVPSLRRSRMGEAGRAHRSMVPDTRGERFVLQQDGVSWPIFCTWANFSFNIRELAIGQRVGAPLDTTHTAEATFLVNEAVEDQAINGLTDEQGSAMTIDGLTVPGLLSSTTTFSYPTWTGLTGPQIVGIVQDAIESLRVTHPNMPFTAFLPGNYSKVLTSDYTAGYPKTTIQRLQELGPWGGRNLEVVIADTLPNDRVVIAAMDRSALDVVVGQQPVPVSWKDGPGWNTFWVVLACIIVRMFANRNDKYGVAVGNLE